MANVEIVVKDESSSCDHRARAAGRSAVRPHPPVDDPKPPPRSEQAEAPRPGRGRPPAGGSGTVTSACVRRRPAGIGSPRRAGPVQLR
uniref:Uncharacterized protein n=1 Tax=uncultured bacterium BAC AB649/1850 TaxID=1037453 RepID=F6K0Z3_9BACT|nr:Hypothetical protein [uncultured bacterium BAC AB649/1850]